MRKLTAEERFWFSVFDIVFMTLIALVLMLVWWAVGIPVWLTVFPLAYWAYDWFFCRGMPE